MKSAYLSVVAIFLAIPVAAEEPVLPLDVSALLDRYDAAGRCHPKRGRDVINFKDQFEEQMAIRQIPECAAIERDRATLEERYKDNKQIRAELNLLFSPLRRRPRAPSANSGGER